MKHEFLNMNFFLGTGIISNIFLSNFQNLEIINFDSIPFQRKKVYLILWLQNANWYDIEILVKIDSPNPLLDLKEIFINLCHFY